MKHLVTSVTCVTLLATTVAWATAPDVIPPLRTTPQASAANPAPSRGQQLYDNHCRGCHDSVAHTRGARKAQSMHDIKQWIVRWAGDQKLEWNAADINDVAEYVDHEFYHFQEP